MSKKYISKENLETFKEELDSSFATKVEVEEKQDSLEFNPTVPAGITPNPLSVLKSDEDYYKIPEGMQLLQIVDSSYGTLTPAELVLARGNNCVIRDQTAHLFIKSYANPNDSAWSYYDCISNNYIERITVWHDTGVYNSSKLYYISPNVTIPSGSTSQELQNFRANDRYYTIPAQTAFCLELAGVWETGTLTDAQIALLTDSSKIVFIRRSNYLFQRRQSSSGGSNIVYECFRLDYPNVNTISFTINTSNKTYTIIQDNHYAVNVIANPALSGSENTLNSLQIGNTKYKLAASISPETLASLYDNTTTYSVGDYVIYNNVLYVCNTAVSAAEDFDSNKWSEIKVTANLGNIETLTVHNNDTLTDAQIQKILCGKLVLLFDSTAYSFIHWKNSWSITLGGLKLAYNNWSGTYFASQTKLNFNTLTINLNTKKVTLDYTSNVTAGIADNPDNALAADVKPAADGDSGYKKIIRALNLRKTQDMICQDYYDATATYNVGDIVIYQNNLYKCNTAISVAEAWDATHWTQVSVKDLCEVQIVEVSGTSGTLSASELEKVQAYNCLLKRGTTLFYKASDNTSLIYKAIKHSISSGKITEDYISISNVGYWEYNNTSNVEFEANPTLSGSEAALNSLKVGNTSYKLAPSVTPTTITDIYDATATYEIGDIVIYDNTLYQCISQITTAEAWTPAHWANTNIKTLLPKTSIGFIDIPGYGTISDNDVLELDKDICIVRMTYGGSTQNFIAKPWTSKDGWSGEYISHYGNTNILGGNFRYGFDITRSNKRINVYAWRSLSPVAHQFNVSNTSYITRSTTDNWNRTIMTVYGYKDGATTPNTFSITLMLDKLVSSTTDPSIQIPVAAGGSMYLLNVQKNETDSKLYFWADSDVDKDNSSIKITACAIVGDPNAS